MKSVGRLAANLLESYQETQEAELALLRDSRAAAESAAYSSGEGFKKDIIYSMHVLRYGGGEDKGGIGFGHFASSFHGKGNALTGIAELDLYRIPTDFGFAQVSQEDGLPSSGPPTGPTEVDEHAAGLVQMLVDAKQGFDDMIEACRVDFADLVTSEKLESANRQAQVNQDIAEAAVAAAESLAASGAEAEDALAASVAEKRAEFLAYTQNILDNFGASVSGQAEKFEGWFAEKLEWVEKLYDSTYKAHLKGELETKLAAALAQLQARTDAAQAVMDAAHQTLATALEGQQYGLWNFHDEQTFQLETFLTETQANSAAAATATNDAFCGAALAEGDLKEANADVLVQDWAFWLKYVYGYQAYNDDLYAVYDDTVDYGDGYAANGFYDELAEPGQLNGPPGYSAQGGIGYGGARGQDYLTAEDAAGLAYGPQTGPDPEYFPHLGGFIDDFRALHEAEQAADEEAAEVEESTMDSTDAPAVAAPAPTAGSYGSAGGFGGFGGSSGGANRFMNGMLALYAYGNQQYSGLDYSASH